MANSFNGNQSWGQNQTYSQSGLQLEHEFDFTNSPGSTSDSQRLSQQQPIYPDSYRSAQYQHQPNGVAPSSMIQSAFPASQPRPVGRTPSYGVSMNAPAEAESSGSYGQVPFTQNQDRNQNPDSFSTMYNNHSSAERNLGWDNPSSFNFQAQVPNSSNYNGSGYNVSDGPNGLISAQLSSSPSPMHDVFPRPSPSNQQYYPLVPTPTASDPRSKRPRNQIPDESRDDEQDAEMSAEARESARAKLGACGRCKTLKVKCEFKTDNDPCKRCLNGGHDCIIPGRKKRRTPPKREHLLNQIREQAAQIKDLIAQLEAANSSSYHRPASVASDSFLSSGLNSPVLSPSSTTTSFLSSDAPSSSADADAATNKAIEEWIAKAKQSFQEFDGFIGIGGAGMPKHYLVEEDLENPESDYEDDYVNIGGSDDGNDDYEFAVEHHDGDDIMTKSEHTLRHKSSASSIGTSSTGVTGQARKKSSENSKLAILPGQAAPFGLFGDLGLKATRKRGSSSEIEEDDKAPGIAGANFFRSTPGPETADRRLANLQNQTPHILTRGIITPKEAEKLFQIYFEHMNLSVSLLDPVLYTAQRTCYRSPFLFTVICAIASRFYSERPELYARVMHYAQLAAGTALISGTKNVEMCQAYILLSLYPVPARKWEDQRSWLYLGLAIRTATDLNLHLPNTAKPLNENHAREMLNRTRVWLNCFNLDRSTGSQYGKAPIISNSDYMANHSEFWWKTSPYNMKNFDIQICVYNSELKVMANFMAKIYSDPHHPTGLNREVDLEKIATETDDELKELGEKWFALLEQTDLNDPQNSFRTGLLKLAFPYARLVALSYGFQHAFGKGHTDENPFLLRCLTAACDVVNAVLSDICRPSQLTYWRHGPEAQSVFVTFASAFLVKLLQPKFASYLTIEKRIEIRELVQKVVDLLSSPEIAIDDRHGPKLYSKFLKSLLAAPMARVELPATMRKARVPKSVSGQTPEPQSDGTYAMFNIASPATSASLSPAPRQTALSFDSFAPVDATDPFAPELAGTSASIGIGGVDDGSTINMMSEFFQPSLPFDEDILQSVRSLSDPSGWQDITLPAGFNWSTQFQQNLGLDIRNQYASMFNDNQYMTGVQQ